MLNLFTRKELDVRGSRNSAKEFPVAINLIAGKQVDVMPVVSKCAPIEEMAGYLKLQSDNPSDYMKIVAMF